MIEKKKKKSFSVPMESIKKLPIPPTVKTELDID